MAASLAELVSLDKLKMILDSIAKATGMNLCVLDTLGKVIIYPCNDACFCKTARQDPVLRQKCLSAAGHAAFEAARLNRPICYKCFFGLSDFVVPLFHKDKYLGAICGGSARSNIENELYDYHIPPLPLDSYHNLLKIYDSMPVIEKERFFEMRTLISKLADFLSYYGVIIELENGSAKKATGLNKLQPAIKYIEKNYTQNLSCEYLSGLCFVTPAYFSRLFIKLTGCTVSKYILNLRISKAKSLLLNRQIKIRSVAEETGYEDVSYFIRKFKQATGLTPMQYQLLNCDGFKNPHDEGSES